MPGLDGTGPRGQGPMTGGGRGLCATAGGFRPIPQVPPGGAAPPLTMGPQAPMAAPFAAGMRGGRGCGRGRGGRGGGRGRGGW